MLLLLLAACDLAGGGNAAKNGKDGDGTATEGPSPWAITAETFTDRSDRQGLLDVQFEVTAPNEVIQIVVETGKWISTEYLYNPDNALVLDWEEAYSSRESLTEAFYPTEFATTLNWPVRAADAPLDVGTWTMSVATLNSQGAYDERADVDVTILRRLDDDPSTGQLHVLLAYAGDLAADQEVTEGVEAAVAYWTELYAKWGITLTVAYTSIDVDPELPDTYEGQAAYEALLVDQPARTLLMVVGDTIADTSYLFGEAGGIPGPYLPTPAAAVEVSWIAHAGGNGKFSEAEIQLMGETMAHETGHYMGLFHPVEDGWTYFDAIEDTPTCTSMEQCDARLGENLMYPYPVCTGYSFDTCGRQDQMTAEQTGVPHRYMGVESP